MAESAAALHPSTEGFHPTAEPATLADRYRAVRSFSHRLCEPLSPEDYVVQSMPDASPTKWHLAHTTWFFETLVLQEALPGYKAFSEEFRYLFNSYYNSLGKQFPRAQRGMLSRPTVAEVHAYRAHVDDAMNTVFDRGRLDDDAALAAVLEIGLHHEQQHQELLLTDLKHMLAQNPTYPVYRETNLTERQLCVPLHWQRWEEGLYSIGAEGDSFTYDNEGPRHRHFQPAFDMSNRLIIAGEYIAFMRDGGYKRPELWLSEGWARVQQDGWSHPLYWVDVDGQWKQFTLGGLRAVNPIEPVCHVSYFEADAFARWFGGRLPTESEWEIVASTAPVTGNFVESERFHPAAAEGVNGDMRQLFGDVWEWTQSAYSPYPGYQPVPGPLGEYNGKFMCGQFVLRGGSCATSLSHIRPTYRNFFPPHARWQFSGIRLARDV